MALKVASASKNSTFTRCTSREGFAPSCYLRRFSQPSTPRHSKPEHRHFKAAIPIVLPARGTATSVMEKVETDSEVASLPFHGVHHVGLLCVDLELSLKFYRDLLGLRINPDRPDDKLPYRGAWLWIGSEMIHLMELPNPDPKDGRPEHGGRDRHVCVGIESLSPLLDKLDAAGVAYTQSKSGRPAVFFRDPDMNTLEVVETAPWR